MNKQKKASWAAYILVFIGTIVYISLIFNNNVWLDEAFTASLIRTDLAGVISRSAQDTLPPFYNILLKLMTDVWGYNIQVMKITSIIPMVFTMLLGAVTVRRRFGDMVSYFFITCMFTMPYLLFYGVEIRMYSWGFFFAAGSMIYGYEVIKKSCRKNWCIFTLLSVGAGYTHHFAFVTVGFVYLFLLLYYIILERKSLRRWFFCLGATILLYIPCLITTLRQFKSVSGYFSMPEITLSVFIKYMRYPFTVGNPLVSIALAVLMILLAVRFVFKKSRSLEDWFAFCCFAAYYGVLLFGTAISKIMTANIFVDRYLFFAFGGIWLFFSISAASLHRNYRTVIFAFLILAGTIGYVKEYRIEYADGLDTLQIVCDANIEAGDGTLSFEEADAIAECLDFYYPELTHYSVEDIRQIKGNIWCIVTEEYTQSFQDFIDQNPYTSEFMGDFRFDRYSFKLYELIPKQ